MTAGVLQRPNNIPELAVTASCPLATGRLPPNSVHPSTQSIFPDSNRHVAKELFELIRNYFKRENTSPALNLSDAIRVACNRPFVDPAYTDDQYPNGHLMEAITPRHFNFKRDIEFKRTIQRIVDRTLNQTLSYTNSPQGFSQLLESSYPSS